jgi:salicylate 5-hydroxylase small subunit
MAIGAASSGFDRMTLPQSERLAWQARIDDFNAEYGAALDAGEYARWIAMFREDGRYKVTARENEANGWPLALLNLEGRGMLQDRVYGITETLYHAPYYQRHVIGRARLLGLDEGGAMLAEAAYAVFRTKPGGVSEIYNVGRYRDRFQADEGGMLLLAERACIYDSEMILNSLIYPI